MSNIIKSRKAVAQRWKRHRHEDRLQEQDGKNLEAPTCYVSTPTTVTEPHAISSQPWPPSVSTHPFQGFLLWMCDRCPRHWATWGQRSGFCSALYSQTWPTWDATAQRSRAQRFSVHPCGPLSPPLQNEARSTSSQAGCQHTGGTEHDAQHWVECQNVGDGDDDRWVARRTRTCLKSSSTFSGWG